MAGYSCYNCGEFCCGMWCEEGSSTDTEKHYLYYLCMFQVILKNQNFTFHLMQNHLCQRILMLQKSQQMRRQFQRCLLKPENFIPETTYTNHRSVLKLFVLYF